MEIGLAVLLVAFLITFGMVKVLQPLAYLIDLVDKPGGRKQHDGVIPLIGGIAVFIGIFLTAYLFLDQPTFIRLFMVGGGFMVFLGAVDDRYDLSPRLRLVGQILVASIFVYGLDIYLANFGNLVGLGNIEVGWAGYFLAILSLVGVVNAFNMLDGIDGLIGSFGLISFMGLAYLFGGAGQTNLALLSMLFIGAVSAFLIFNIWGVPSRQKRINKIFMGDAGSMFLGLALGVLLIYGSQAEIKAFDPVIAIWFVLLPMTDMFTLMYRRIRRGKSPVAPDRTHIHHILMRAGFKPWQALYILVLVQTVLVLFGITASVYELPEYVSFAAALGFVGFYQVLMKRSWQFIRWNKRRFAAAS
ncbi:undecaprenyl/decaprenyl-phosphate alpha-N-acetylglucosaminyl 1-phosphate transferase [Saccharophagus sp. K07]|uniref:undecaprenyl/decaprenyl-phosphate alpha-N-acetylglucosaminyl 1-phosphate transferase n=1 Tax=Saccharophagus sp. K07 TaxID=2283636 RepID=UPI001651EB7D|nr:undecaprenyl/decaprenyl-phosphate alpha-N-acetylglucosaminyl 1-phosphate transferase [Saccharophagus sp. K07]MBC6907467.1 undecaprenyl/decaprenyl-phosphate alpha-N-acetylglucosaminyl 1-phosphate transferase [Saccharophagus sp. K07]